MYIPCIYYAIWFGEEMSRCVHIHGICNVYKTYMSVISIVYIWPELFLLTAGLFWQLSLLIHSTLESVTTIMTLLMIKTVFALCIPSCLSIVCGVPSVLGWAAAIVATRIFRSTWFSSAPLRNFAWGLPMVLALTRVGAAMFTRSIPGCGTLDGPSLAWAASLWPKLRRSEGNPGLRFPSADVQLRT